MVSLLRFEDVILGPRTIPNNNPFHGKKEIPKGSIFKVDVEKNVVSVATEPGKFLDVGDEMVYHVRTN